MEDTLLSKCYCLSLSSSVLRCHGQETWPSWGRNCGDTARSQLEGRTCGGMEVLVGARQDLAQPQSERTLDARPPILQARRLGDDAQGHPGTPEFPSPYPRPARSWKVLQRPRAYSRLGASSPLAARPDLLLTPIADPAVLSPARTPRSPFVGTGHSSDHSRDHLLSS